MLCVVPYFKGDRDLAQKLVAWIKELGDPPTLYLVRDARAEPIDTMGLDVRKEIVVTESWNVWPKSPNWMISQVGRDITEEPWLWCEPDCVPMAKGWWQALKGEWDKARAVDKWFVGDRVEVENVPVHMSGIAIYPPNVIEHAGLMLIAHDIAFDVEASNMILPKMYQTKLIGHAWKHPPFTNTGELDNLRGQHPDMVLFHADKAHSIIPMLRAEFQQSGVTARPPSEDERNHGGRNLTVLPTHSAAETPLSGTAEKSYMQQPATAEAHAKSATGLVASAPTHGLTAGAPSTQSTLEGGELKQHAVLGDTLTPRSTNLSGDTEQKLQPSVDLAESSESRIRRAPPAQSLTCDIFIKTYPPDYPWLHYCLRSIDKFATGFRRVVIVHPEGQPIWDTPSRFHVVEVGEQPDGYLWQMVIKLDADRYTDASHILYIDSDTIFTTPVEPKNYLANGKVIWMMTPYEKVSTPWQPTIEKFLKKPVRFEFMRRQPFLVPRWLLAELRAFCEREHGITLDSYILGQPHRAFSEFNALGAFAYEFFRDEFVWVNTEETPPDQWPELTVMQSWSRGGLTDQIKATYDKILSGEDSPASDRELEEVKQEGGEVPDNAVSEMPLQQDAPPSTFPYGMGDTIKPDFEVPIRLNSNAAKWDRVEQLVLELKGYCDNPSSTSRVRKALIGGGIFPDIILSWLKQGKRKRKRVSSK